jgi:hypothetical protein
LLVENYITSHDKVLYEEQASNKKSIVQKNKKEMNE